MTRLLIVEDEDVQARALLAGLRDEGYVVDRARDGEEALWLARSGHHDAVLLDLRLPALGGLEVCRWLRAGGSRVPILMLTASDSTEEVVRGLDAGADDYLAKPFALAELLARIRALLRRGSAGGSQRLRVRDVVLDLRERRVWRGSREVPLSALEFRLLLFLVRHPGEVLGRARLIAALWEDSLGPDSNVLEVCISRLRKKLDDDSESGLIRTRRGEGYVLWPGTPSNHI